MHLVLAMVDQPLGGPQHRVVRPNQLPQVHLYLALKIRIALSGLTAMLAKSLSRSALTERREVG